MRSLLHLLRLLVGLGLLLPASTPAPGDALQRAFAAWSSAGPVCADVAGEGRLCTWTCRAPSSAQDSSSGFGGAGARIDARHAEAPRCAVLASPGAFPPGELSAAQAFLRVNGSANANGARA